MKYRFILGLVVQICCSASLADEAMRKTIWQGNIHLGDNPAQYSHITSTGMTMQVPYALDSHKNGKLIVTTRDVETLAGDGHYGELMAHYEDDGGPASEFVVETFRLKGNSRNVDTDHTFDFDPMKGLQSKPAYYSVRIRIDTQIKFSLWDDFVVKQIDIQQ
jgi:hypothetical protein